VQDVTVSTTVLGVKTTNTVDLGTSSLKFKDFYLAGNALIGGTLGVTGATTLSAALTYGGVTLSNAVTGTGNMVLSASPTLTGTITAAAANFSGAVALNGNATIGDADTDTITQAASYVTGTQLKSAKTATNTLSLAAYDVDGTAYTNLITLTASNTPTLALTSTGVGTINNMSIGATTASTGAFTTLTSNGATTFTAGTASTTTGTGTLVITGGLGVSGRINAANFDGIIGANTAAAGSFTSLSATAGTSVATSSGYLTVGTVSATGMNASDIGIPNNKYLRGTVVAGTSSVALIGLDSGNIVQINANGSSGGTNVTGTFSSTLGATIQGLTVGRGAGAVSTNTAVGASALGNGSQTGTVNTAIGAFSLYSNTSGTGNTGVGQGAMYLNTTGGSNSSFGDGALGNNTTGGTNTALGRQSLTLNTTASRNTAIGYQAGYSVTTTGVNVFVGSYAGRNNTGSQNVAVGDSALQGGGAGQDNISLGYASLTSNTSGNSNVGIGTQALTNNTTASNNTAVGYQAGYQATGTDNTLLGRSAGYTLTSGTQNTFVGYGARGSSASASTQIVIGYDLTGQGDSYVTLGSSTGKVYNAFTVNATWTQTSDERLKKNIQEDTLGLSFINRLRPVKFTWKPSNELEQDNPYYAEENKRNTTTVIHGLIAQEVKAALDAEGVDTFAGWDMGPDGIQAISREMFISPLIKAIQELKAEIDSLKSQLNGA
jgi:hypothetical protein